MKKNRRKKLIVLLTAIMSILISIEINAKGLDFKIFSNDIVQYGKTTVEGDTVYFSKRLVGKKEIKAMSATSNEDKIWNFFKGKGFSDAGVAGIMGNLQAESGFDPSNLENAANKKSGYSDAQFTSAVDNGSISRSEFISSSKFSLYSYKDSTGKYYTYGYGLAQWTFYSRKANLYDYWKRYGGSIGGLSMQLNFMYKEMTPSLKNYLTNAVNVSDACVRFHNIYEGSADDATRIAGRVSNSKTIYKNHSSYYNGITSGSNTGISTKTHNPIGYLEEVEGGNGTIRVKGWALDYDNLNAALNVHVYVGGPKGGTQYAATNGDVIANQSRPDVPKNLGSSVGEYHGFDYTFKVNATGTYPVYVYAINVGAKDTADCNSLLTLAPKIVTIKAAEQVCSTPDVLFSDIAGGKQLKITAASGETIHYAVNKDGAENSGTASGSYTTTFSEKGNYTVSAYSSKAGCKNSGKTTKQVTVSAVETPTITQSVTGDGVVLSMQSKTDGATIYYTTSGNTPTVSSNKFTGAVTVNSEKTIKAIAVKAGYVNSEISKTKVKLSVPDSPQNFALTSESKIAVGENATVKWDAMPSAASYTVTVYKDNKEVSHVTTSGTTATINLSSAGKYRIKIYATNFVGNSVEADTVLETEAMAPLTVKFVDWDDSLIKTQEVSYGKDASLPEEPGRKGYTFTSWTNADKIKNVKGNLTLKATYKINTYLVRFYDASGNQVGASQKVEYGSAAISPEDKLTDIPTGYVFSGWKVIDSANDSLCDYRKVDSDLKLQAVYYWENEELPIVNKITDAKWDAVSGNYTVKVKLTNYPKAATTALLRVSLYTSQGKMVKSSKTEFEVAANGNTEKEIVLKYSGTATVAKVCTLGIKGNDLTGSALSKENSSKIVCLSDTVWSDWSDWGTNEIKADSDTDVEKITQYRYSDKATTTSSSSAMEGWTKYNTTSNWSDYGAWSGWSENAQSASDSRQVESRKVYRYYCFYCPVCGGREPFTGRSDCHQYNLTQANAQVTWSTVPYSACNPQGYSYTTAKKWTTSLGDGLRWNLTTADIGQTTVGYQGDAGCSIIRMQYRYRTRSLNYTYYYYKWSDWSAWSETKPTESDTRKVETRTIYRKRVKVPVYDDVTGTEETGTKYTFSGKLNFTEPDLIGKLATVMVYKGKNTDPNEDQIQYVGQTTIGKGNTYSFDVTAKSDPSILSGDYTICLGVEGSTGLINVDMLKAPKAKYTVKYVDDDGKILSTQTVSDGQNAVVPKSPTKEGYLFVGWSGNATQVHDNMTIVAVYAPVQYVVAFVDSVNGTVNCDTYNYGDEIKVPENPSAEGKVFKGWDKLSSGKNIVKENMVINAVYENQTFTVKFCNEKGSTVSEQKVEYGHTATPPSSLEVAGKEFLGWSTDKEWWNVTENITVKPILVYAETTSAPSYNIVEMDDDIAVYLESDTENADIYYAVGDDTLDTSSTKYEGEPIILPMSLMDSQIEEDGTKIIMKLSTDLKAYATSDNKNDSEVQNIHYQTTKIYNNVSDYTVTFDANGGDKMNPEFITVTPGEKLGELLDATREDYVFDGWYTEKTGGTKIDESTVVKGDCTIYAHWRTHEHSYTETITKKATCTTNGTKTFKCACGDAYEETIKATGHLHKETRNKKEATETTEGYTGDIYCKDCNTLLEKGKIIPKLEETVDKDAPIIQAESVQGYAGDEVTIPVTIKQNSGIAGFSYDVNYDSSKLQLKKMAAGTVTKEGAFTTNGNVVNWYTTDNITANGTILNITFTILKDTADGKYPVSISLHDGKKNLVNEEGIYVKAAYKAGEVEVVSGILGDINGDKDITIADVVLLNRYVLGKASLDSGKKKLADINSDGDVTIGDVVLLNRQVLGKDTPATVKLAPKKSRKKATARASEEMKISVDNVSTKAGETISIPVRISNNQGIAGIAFSVELPEGYSLVSMKKGEVTSEGTFTVSENNCTWYTTDNIKTDGILLTLEVKAGENAKTGKIKVNVKDGKANNISDENGMTVPAVFTEGTVTIQEDSCAVNGHKGGKATCIKKAVCTVCGKEYGEVDPTNHEGETELRNVKKATCTEDGNTGDTYCKSCGTKIKDGKVIKALGHKFTKYVSDNNATTTKDGTKTARCDNGCGTKNTVVDKGSKKTNPSQSPKIKIGQKLQNSVGVRCAITGKNTAECIGYVGKKNSVTIPPSLKYMGVTYQITSIKTKAFSGNKNLRSIVIPSSIRTIGSQAFFNCKNLRNITIKTPYLSKKTVGAKAFKGIHAKAKIKVPKKQKKAYQKLLKAKGAGKKVTIK